MSYCVLARVKSLDIVCEQLVGVSSKRAACSKMFVLNKE